jgi:transcriptional regulator of acetoin/glycerol metabolism
MLWVEGDPQLRSLAAGMHFVEGARWGEDVAGTNAPGTALALDHAVQIYGSEHFRRPVQPWSCSAAPVHDPFTGALLGAIDVTGGDHVASPHVMTLVRATVAAVEGELRWLHREQARRMPAAAPARAVPRLEVLGRERARLTLPSGRVDLSLRHSELLLLLAEAAVGGEGRTAARLAAECHAADAAAVTVRAELTRLRRVIGDDLLASRP